MELGKPQREYILEPREIPVPVTQPIAEPAAPTPEVPALEPLEQPAAV